MSLYYTDNFTSEPVYRCIACQYDTYSKQSADDHAWCAHPTLQMPPQDMEPVTSELRGKKLAICFITWNDLQASEHAACSIDMELGRCFVLGIHHKVFWVDNGSTDGTYENLRLKLGQSICQAARFSQNMGASAARNEAILQAMDWGADYIALVDGDIEVIPRSLITLAEYLDHHDIHGCIGLHSRNNTKLSLRAAQSCYFIEDWMVHAYPEIAWTQYGVFSRDVFDNGVLFDVNGPFMGPGWGMEDEDLYLQLKSKGYECLNTPAFCHVHHTRHASIEKLGRSKVAQILKDRQQYMRYKWKNYPQFAGNIARISNHLLP